MYKDDQSTFQELLKKDNPVTIHHRNIQVLAIELYKCNNNLAIDIMNEIFIDRKYSRPDLRTQTEFVIPPINTVYKGENSLRYLGPLIWKIVSDKLKKILYLKRFKTEIKKWVPSKCPCRLCKNYVQGLGYV